MPRVRSRCRYPSEVDRMFHQGHTMSVVVVRGKASGFAQEVLDRIERHILLEGPLNKEERVRLLEIAERYPVHRTLTSEISIRTQLAS